MGNLPTLEEQMTWCREEARAQQIERDRLRSEVGDLRCEAVEFQRARRHREADLAQVAQTAEAEKVAMLAQMERLTMLLEAHTGSGDTVVARREACYGIGNGVAADERSTHPLAMSSAPTFVPTSRQPTQPRQRDLCGHANGYASYTGLGGFNNAANDIDGIGYGGHEASHGQQIHGISLLYRGGLRTRGGSTTTNNEENSSNGGSGDKSTSEELTPKQKQRLQMLEEERDDLRRAAEQVRQRLQESELEKASLQRRLALANSRLCSSGRPASSAGEDYDDVSTILDAYGPGTSGTQLVIRANGLGQRPVIQGSIANVTMQGLAEYDDVRTLLSVSSFSTLAPAIDARLERARVTALAAKPTLQLAPPQVTAVQELQQAPLQQASSEAHTDIHGLATLWLCRALSRAMTRCSHAAVEAGWAKLVFQPPMSSLEASMAALRKSAQRPPASSQQTAISTSAGAAGVSPSQLLGKLAAERRVGEQVLR